MSRSASLMAFSRMPIVGMALVTGLTLGASGVNFVVQALLAYRFGLGTRVDSYAFSLSAPVFVAGLIAAIISYTVVPLIVREGADPARRAALCGITLLVAGGAALTLAAAAPLAMLLQPLGLPRGSAIAAEPHLAALIGFAWLAAALQVLTAVLTAQLTADHRPVAAATLALGPGIGAATALLVLPKPYILIVSLGFLVGCVGAVAAGLWLQRGRLALRRTPGMRAEIGDLMRRGAWAALALSCFSSFAPSDAFWATRMPEGSLASLGYVQRLIIGVGGLIVAGPSALYVPRFAALIKAEDGAGFAQLLARTLAIVLGLGAVAIGLLYLYSEPVVSLLFRRGAFGSDDVIRLAALFRTMAPGVVAMLAAVILMRALFCLKRAEVAAAILGMAWPISYFILSGLFHHQGVAGIARSYSIAWAIIAIAIAAYVFQRIGRLARSAKGDQVGA